MNESEKEIDRNLSEDDVGSFLYFLHEMREWNDEAYWKLDKAIYGLAKKYSNNKSIPREISYKIMRIFSYSFLLIGCHFDPNDYGTIENMESEDVYDRRERLQLVVEGFFLGKMPNNESFEYVNPLLKG